MQRWFAHNSRTGYIILTLLFCLLAGTNADAQQQQIVVDAGSSKTRAILYQLDAGDIKAIAEASNKQPLALFRDKPQAAGQQLIIPLLNNVLEQATQNGSLTNNNAVRVNILGTAGMRELSPEAQQAIWHSVRQAVQQQGLEAGEIRTLDGREEGAFAWAHLNQLQGLAGGKDTPGDYRNGWCFHPDNLCAAADSG